MNAKQDDKSSVDNFHFNKAIVLDSFDAWTYTKGERYFRSGAVESWEANKDGINGKVKGSYSPYYRTKLRIRNGRLIGTCSCPVGVSCKHCVALALQWLEDKNNQSRESRTSSMRQLKLSEENNILEEEHQYPNEVDRISEIPLELKKNPIQDVKSFLQILPRADLENLVSFFMKEFTKTREITIFSPQFISTIWNPHLIQIDDDFKKSKTIQKSPLTILKLIKDEKAKIKCIKAWFKGYMDLISQIKYECRLRGILDEDGEELYEYYKNEEYDRLEEEIREESNERYDNSYNRWDYNDYDYLEPYEDFILDTSTLESYLEDFFSCLYSPILDICDYSLYLHKYHLINYKDYLIEKGIQWLKDLTLPNEDLGINPENISALLDLQSMIASKISLLTNFSTERDQLNYLYSNFIQNPSLRNSETIWAQLHRMNPTEEDIQYFIQKILKNFEDKPTWEKFTLLKRLILKHKQELLSSLLEVSIDNLFKALDAEHILKEIFSILETQPTDMTLTMESDLKQASLKITPKSYKRKVNVYRMTIDWLVNYYNQKKMFDRAFISLIELAKERPKMFKFKDYETLKKILPDLTDKFISEYDHVISLLIQKGTKEVGFRLLLDLEKYDQACERLITSSSTNSDFHPPEMQLGAIMRLLPYISSISDTNKENMLKILKALITDWVARSSKYRPDATLAEAISQIRTIYLAFKTKEGDLLWKKWFKSFSNKHWRLRNLRSALKRKGIEMKKT